MIARGEKVWVLTYKYDKRSEAKSELFSGTQKEVIAKIVVAFGLDQKGQPFTKNTPTKAMLLEHLDEHWMDANLELLKVG